MKLYLVEATNADYDTFDSAVVYANDPIDACEIVRAEIAKSYSEGKASGAWFPIMDNQTLTATPIERKRGAVHGHGRPG